MTNHWIDIKNADSVLIIGSNAAEHHPVAFKWIMRAKDNGATLMHVDPKFSRTSARCDFHVPLRSGTDIAFLGGMVNFILEKKLYQADYVASYTNAAFVVGKDYDFKDGLFSGYDAAKRKYDKSSWAFEKGPDGAPLMDPDFKNERCVINLMRKHYSRYTLKNVSDITGVSEADLLKVYENFCATGKPDKAGTILYALGWTQHTIGVQIIRCSTLIQQLLGNIGVAGGGINALRGEPNVQGSTDHAVLYHILPGYHATPQAPWATLADYLKANTPVTKLKNSANWWGNRPKYMVSLLKGWFGDAATKENDFCYEYLPKLEPGVDYSYMYVMDKMYQGKMRGGLIFGVNPMNSFSNTNKMRAALDKLDWLVCSEIHNSETTENWHRPDVDPAKVKTEVFLLPSAHRIEKEGTISNSGRWLQWFDQGVKPGGEARSFGNIYVPLINKIRELYKKDGGVLPEPLLKLNWTDKFDAAEWTRRINGFFCADSKVGDKMYKRGQLVPAFGALKDDGTTSSLNWLYAGSWTEEDGNKSKRRDKGQTPMQAKIGLYPNWSWCWPVNRRILYNRASVDVNGNPWNPGKAVIAWRNGKWEGDVPDGPWPPQADKEKGKLAFIMKTDGYAQLYGPGPNDGPLPEHYEPAETPISKHPFSKQLSSPVYKFHTSDMDAIAPPADPRFPYVLTTYSLTEHWCGGCETRNVPNLLEAEPQLYVEMSHELAKEKGIANGDGVILESVRGKCEAIAMVTVRIRPFTVMGKTIHLVGMPFAYGWTTPKCGDSTNRLTVPAYDPNTTIQESKACCVNLRKAEKLTEIG
jgi:formate dehydrogenase major subunit